MGKQHIVLEWFDDTRQILFVTFQNGWEWKEFNTALDQIELMLDQSDNRVVIIFDIQSVSKVPLNIIKEGKQVFARTPHAQLDSLIITGSNQLLDAVFRAFQALLPSQSINKWNIISLATLKEALEYASRHLLSSRQD